MQPRGARMWPAQLPVPPSVLCPMHPQICSSCPPKSTLWHLAVSMSRLGIAQAEWIHSEGEEFWGILLLGGVWFLCLTWTLGVPFPRYGPCSKLQLQNRLSSALVGNQWGRWFATHLPTAGHDPKCSRFGPSVYFWGRLLNLAPFLRLEKAIEYTRPCDLCLITQAPQS